MNEELKESNSELNNKIEKIAKLWELYSFHTWNFDKIIFKSKDFKAPIFTENDWVMSIISFNWNNFELVINSIYERLINADTIIVNYSWELKNDDFLNKIERVFKYDTETQNFIQIKWSDEKTWIEIKVYDTIDKISKIIKSIF